jgi:hypothetical protein
VPLIPPEPGAGCIDGAIGDGGVGNGASGNNGATGASG